jgi:serine/threonine-protein kinase
VAYWLLTGRLVFDEQTYGAMLLAHVQKEPVPPSQRAEQSIPPSLDAIVLDCLKKSPADRIQSAEELAARLDAVELTETWTSEDARRWWESHGKEITGARSQPSEVVTLR